MHPRIPSFPHDVELALEVCGGEHGSCITGPGRWEKGNWAREIQKWCNELTPGGRCGLQRSSCSFQQQLALGLSLSHQRFLLYYTVPRCANMPAPMASCSFSMMYNIVSIETRRLKRAGRRDGGLLNLQSIITPLTRKTFFINFPGRKSRACYTHSLRRPPCPPPARPLARTYSRLRRENNILLIAFIIFARGEINKGAAAGKYRSWGKTAIKSHTERKKRKRSCALRPWQK